MSDIQTIKTETVYERLTKQIVEAIEAGAGAGGYKMPWHISDSDAFSPVNAVSKRPYRGVNVLSLWLAAESRSFTSGLWATYKQWKELGAQVRKGEKSCLVVFWKVYGQQGEGEKGRDKGTEKTREKWERRPSPPFVARGYPVFNVAQVEGYTPPQTPLLSEKDRIESAERFFAALGADIRHGGFQAFYDPAGDYIQMPRFEAFREASAFYSTLGHESIHWAGAEDRLNRNIVSRFGSSAYAAEELIAELGAAFLCAALKISNEPRADHATYVSGWLELLRRDKRAIFVAASKAQEAVVWMQSRQDEIPELLAEVGA